MVIIIRCPVDPWQGVQLVSCRCWFDTMHYHSLFSSLFFFFLLFNDIIWRWTFCGVYVPIFHLPGETNNRRWFRSLLLCPCDIFQALINSLCFVDSLFKVTWDNYVASLKAVNGHEPSCYSVYTVFLLT